MPTKKTDPLLIELDVTDSSNNYAMGLIHAGVAQHGQAVLAYQQTEGRGQRGKSWESPPGESLSLSVLLQPHFLHPALGFRLLATTALTVVQVLRKVTGEEMKIKWPNDIYWRNRKAGGILIESVLQGQTWNWAVVGIGINVNQLHFPGSLPNPVSLLQITGNPYPVRELAEEITCEMVAAIARLQQEGFDAVLEEYNHLLYKKGQPACFKQGNRRFTSVVAFVDEEGCLHTGLNGEEQFRFGQLEWIPEF